MLGQITLACGAVATVDADDLPRLLPHPWHRLMHGGRMYARTSMKAGDRFRTVLMHRYLLNPNPTQVIDHRNGNGLDNRRENLRLATPKQNSHNRKACGDSGYVGVKRSGRKWMAMISPNDYELYLGSFASAAEAAAIYNEAAKTVYGEFAHLNDVPAALAESWQAVLRTKSEEACRCQARSDKAWRALALLTDGPQ